MENRKLKVFLCHSKEDKTKVRKLYQRLVADGFDAWLDEEKLMPGQKWDLEIQKVVRETDVVVVCLSNNSVTKAGYFQKEIKIALDVADEQPEDTIYLIPARFEDCNVPNRLKYFHWVDLFNKSGYSKLRETLNQCLRDLNKRFGITEVSPKNSINSARIPILGVIDSSTPVSEPKLSKVVDYDKESIEIDESLIPAKENSKYLFALTVKGDSLADAMIHDGDIVIMKPTQTANNGDMVALWLSDRNESTLKYFYKEKDGYRLQPANPEFKPIIVNSTEKIEIKGKVVMVIRKVDKYL